MALLMRLPCHHPSVLQMIKPASVHDIMDYPWPIDNVSKKIFETALSGSLEMEHIKPMGVLKVRVCMLQIISSANAERAQHVHAVCEHLQQMSTSTTCQVSEQTLFNPVKETSLCNNAKAPPLTFYLCLLAYDSH